MKASALSDNILENLKYIANSPDREHGGFHPNTVNIAKEAIEQIERLEKANAAMRWTLVSNAMPPYDGDYLCIVRLPQDCGSTWYRRRVEYCENNSFDEKVIAWMPMLEIPKWPEKAIAAIDGKEA